MYNFNTTDMENYAAKMDEKYSDRSSDKLGFKEFKEAFTEAVEKEFGSGGTSDIEIENRLVDKVNETYDAFTVKYTDSDVGVNISINDAYDAYVRQDVSIEELTAAAVARTAEALQNAPVISNSINDIQNYDAMKNNRNKYSALKYMYFRRDNESTNVIDLMMNWTEKWKGGQIFMMYPYLTLDDGTEITHSQVLENGRIKVYVETPVGDGFHNATCYLPGYEWSNISGYSKEEMIFYDRLVKENSHLILELASEREFQGKEGLSSVESKGKSFKHKRESFDECRNRLFVATSGREPLDDGLLSTAYIEFYPGEWDGESFWNAASMNLAFDLFVPDIIHDFVYKIIGMDPYDTTGFRIDHKKWEDITAKSKAASGVILEVFNLLDEWCSKIIEKEGVITLIGL